MTSLIQWSVGYVFRCWVCSKDDMTNYFSPFNALLTRNFVIMHCINDLNGKPLKKEKEKIHKFCDPELWPSKQCTNKSSWFGTHRKKTYNGFPKKTKQNQNIIKIVWEGCELIDSFKLPPQTRGNARNTPEKTNRVVPLLSGITIHGQREFSSRASNNSVKFCQPINHIIPMRVLKRQAT